MPATATDAIMALDVGEARIGVAIARGGVRIAHPLTTLARHEGSVAEIIKLAAAESAGRLVVGLPRGLDGQDTAQTKRAGEFIDELTAATDMPVDTQDEALTSVKAETELQARNKPYEKGAVDALAAAYILEDYLEQLPERGAHAA